MLNKLNYSCKNSFIKINIRKDLFIDQKYLIEMFNNLNIKEQLMKSS